MEIKINKPHSCLFRFSRALYRCRCISVTGDVTCAGSQRVFKSGCKHDNTRCQDRVKPGQCSARIGLLYAFIYMQMYFLHLSLPVL